MLNGIDISSWQSGIDISALTTTDFVIVKATGGTGYTNPDFRVQADAVLASGKLLGLYHYAREKSCKGTAAQEADHFLDAAQPYLGRAVLVLDWEEELSCGESWAKAWMDRVQQKTGVKPLFYCYQAALSSYNFSSIAGAGYPLWLAQYANMKTTGYQASPWQSGSIGAFVGYVMHQYSSCGRITGYGSNLDLNQFRGTKADWAALAKGESNVSSTTAQKSTVDYSPCIAAGVQRFTNATGAALPVYASTRMYAGEKIGSISAGESCWCFGKVWSPAGKRWLWAIAYELTAAPGEYKLGYTDDGGGTSFS